MPIGHYNTHVSVLLYQCCNACCAVFVQRLLPAGCALHKQPAVPKITFVFSVSVSLCAPLIMCAIITSHTLSPCDLTLDGCFV